MSKTTCAPAVPTKKSKPVIEVAPNRFVQMDMAFELPKTVFADMVPVEGQTGTFRLVPRSWEQLERVSRELCHKLGLGGDTVTLRRLIRGGFVHGARTAPKIYAVNLASYFAHMERCAEDPDFWENPKVRRKYQESYF